MVTETYLAGGIAETTQQPARAPSRRLPHLRTSLGAFAICAAFALVEALVPKWHHLLWQLLYLVAPVLVSGVFHYLRDLHPNRVPAPLAADSPLLTKLRRIKKILAGIGFGSLALLVALLFGGVSGFLDRLSPATCLCETHPLLFVWLLLTPAILGLLGYSVLSAYIKERTAAPPPTPRRSSSWLPTQPRIYKPLQSNRWGQK